MTPEQQAVHIVQHIIDDRLQAQAIAQAIRDARRKALEEAAVAVCANCRSGAEIQSHRRFFWHPAGDLNFGCGGSNIRAIIEREKEGAKP